MRRLIDAARNGDAFKSTRLAVVRFGEVALGNMNVSCWLELSLLRDKALLLDDMSESEVRCESQSRKIMSSPSAMML